MIRNALLCLTIFVNIVIFLPWHSLSYFFFFICNCLDIAKVKQTLFVKFKMTSRCNTTLEVTPLSKQFSSFSNIVSSHRFDNPESKFLTRFGDLTSQMFEVIDVINKILQFEIYLLRKKSQNLEIRIVSLETNTAQTKKFLIKVLFSKVIKSAGNCGFTKEILHGKVIWKYRMRCNDSDNDNRACHRTAKSHSDSEKTIVRFVGKRHVNSAQYKRKNFHYENICCKCYCTFNMQQY